MAKRLCSVFLLVGYTTSVIELGILKILLFMIRTYFLIPVNFYTVTLFVVQF